MTTPAPQKRPAYEPVARLLQPTGYNPAMRRPITTVAGVALVLLRVLVGALVLASIAAAWGPLVHAAPTLGSTRRPSRRSACGWCSGSARSSSPSMPSSRS